jgi:coenzyme F420-reducing hydrogenase beta subunit
MSYKVEDVVNNNLCVGCGLCVSESTTSKMHWNEEGFLVPILDNSFNERAIKLCPFNPVPEEEVKDEDVIALTIFPNSQKEDFKIGRFENTYIGFSKQHRESASSGGIATYIFEKLLIENIVNHLFIVREFNGTYQYQWFENANQIQEISKTRYIPVTMENLFKEIDSKEGKIAVSGVACFIKAIRLKQHYNPVYREKISFLVGIICGGLKSRFFTDYLAQNSGIKGNYKNQEYRIKDKQSLSSDYSFGAFDENNKFHQMKMAKVGDMWGTGLFKANACDFCDDVTTELADISLGDAWLPEYRSEGLGNSIIITRSLIADSLIREGIENEELFVNIVSKDKIIQSQKASFVHRQDSLEFRKRYLKIKIKKRDRFVKPISIHYKLVQIYRRKARKRSIVFWRNKPNLICFNKSMKVTFLKLKIATKLNHKLRK